LQQSRGEVNVTDAPTGAGMEDEQQPETD